MEFTKDELRGIVSMGRHERVIVDLIETMVPGIKVHQAQAITTTIMAKADAMADAIEKAERAKAAAEEKKEAEK